MTTSAPEKEAAVLQKVLRDDVLCIENFFHIPHKSTKQMLPMRLRPIQRKMLTTGRKRIIVLKSSQVGSTSAWTAAFFRRTMFEANTISVIMAHRGELSRHLLERTETFYNEMPHELRQLNPIGGDSKTEKSFPKVGSRIYIGTAGGTDFGRGEPIHNFLASEWLFYTEEQFNNIVLPATQRVPENGTAVLESTPNGENFGYELIQESLAGRTPWHVMVFYWFEDADNKLSSESPLLIDLEHLKGKLKYDSDERYLVREHKLTMDQIRWRRFKILELGDLFYQEQLESLDTCFLSIRDAYYDRILAMQLGQHESKPITGIANAEVWEPPIKGVQYYMGVDPGQARYTESVAWVVRQDEKGYVHCVAMLAGKYPPDIMAAKCMELGYAYNTAWMNPEANGHGIAFIDAVKHNYPRLMMRRNLVTGLPMNDFGWLTTAATKPYMMEELNRRLKDMVLPDNETIRQVRAWRYDDRQRVVTTAMDDRHDALAFAVVALPTTSTKGKAKGPSGFTSWDRHARH